MMDAGDMSIIRIWTGRKMANARIAAGASQTREQPFLIYSIVG
jgi:hypothetical protein